MLAIIDHVAGCFIDKRTRPAACDITGIEDCDLDRPLAFSKGEFDGSC
jgi:hypothetical protein